MSRGYSAPVVLCLCALCFVFGRFIKELPGLPEASKGFAVKQQGTSLRRKAIEQQKTAEQLQEETAQLQQPRHAPETARIFHSFEEQLGVSNLLADKPPVAITGEGEGSNEYTMQPFQMLSWYPRAYLFPGFMDRNKAEHVVNLAKARLAPSVLALRKEDTETTTRDVRTSSGTFIARNEDKEGVLAWIEDRTAQLTGLPVAHGEPFNVLRYQLGQHYDAHYDVFDPESYGPQPSQRMATVLFYLTDVEEGGETIFPLEGKHGLDRLQNINYKSCSEGLKYKPRAGDALLFWSLHPNGTFDRHALHGGCPVIKGEKFVATKWIRDKCFGSCDREL
ncbi:hypothetical protein WJX72_001216 [[Myrmecia] bisecta]|uniref:procollagen-proline 4-dioxygenase n=1 Tax=[Myrmecia] bisecta TaxID=41462 RepID=A0AAW1PT31_9CHLO